MDDLAKTIGLLVIYLPLLWVIIVILGHWMWFWGSIEVALGRGMAHLLLWRWLPAKWNPFDRES
jgi:hypothetical protein